MKIKRVLLPVAFLMVNSLLLAQTVYIPSGTSGIGNSANSNVGIGTSSPELTLDVHGPVRSKSGTIDVRLQAGAGGAAGVGTFSNDPLLFLTNSAERVRVAATGYMGVGTQAPQRLLHLHSASANTQFYISDSAPSITLGNNENYWAATMYGLLAMATSNGNYSLNAGDMLLAAYGDSRGNIYVNSNYSGSGITHVILQPSNGNVGIGTTNPTQKLSVNGTIRAKEVIVDTGWADYVFADDYRLAPLAEVEEHIKAKKHLPGIPSAVEVADHGVSMGDMQARLLAKIEEITLHQIAQEKAISSLRVENAELRERVIKLLPPTR